MRKLIQRIIYWSLRIPAGMDLVAMDKETREALDRVAEQKPITKAEARQLVDDRLALSIRDELNRLGVISGTPQEAAILTKIIAERRAKRIRKPRKRRSR